MVNTTIELTMNAHERKYIKRYNNILAHKKELLKSTKETLAEIITGRDLMALETKMEGQLIFEELKPNKVYHCQVNTPYQAQYLMERYSQQFKTCRNKPKLIITQNNITELTDDEIKLIKKHL